MSTRSILGMVFTLDALKARGIDSGPVLSRFGLDLHRLSPEAEIDRTVELRIYSELANQITDPLTGLEIGRHMSLAGYGPFIMLLMTCKNAWDAFQAGIRYQALTYLFGDLRLQPGNQHSSLCLHPVPLPAHCRRFLIDRDISGTYQLIRDIQTNLGTDIHPARIGLPYPRPHEYRAYEERFQCELAFDRDYVEISVPNQALAINFPAANPTAHALYRNQCDQILEERARREQACSQVRQQVFDFLELFVSRFPTIGEVALTFGLSERSLRRRLADENTSYREVLDEVRSRKACALLSQSSHSIEHIAQQLGYAEAAAFIHAFQRWHKQTPAAYRQRL